jgi:uncharacterized protein YndB with AHSA1/START domain
MSDAVRTSIDIDASPEEVWEAVMDAEQLDDWVTIHRKLLSVSDQPLKKGSTMKQVLCLRGVKFKVEWKVVEYDAPRLAVMEGKGPARSKAYIRDELRENEDGGTRFEYTNDFSAPLGPLGKAASSVLVGGIPRREADASLKKLKRLVERNGK